MEIQQLLEKGEVKRLFEEWIAGRAFGSEEGEAEGERVKLILLPVSRGELLSFVERLEERDPMLALEMAKVFANAQARMPEKWFRSRTCLPPFFACKVDGKLAYTVVRSWAQLERLLFPTQRAKGLTLFATRAGRRYLCFVYEASGKPEPPLIWCTAAPPEAAFEPYFSWCRRVGADTVVDAVAWDPVLEQRKDKREALALLLKAAAFAGSGPQLLVALPKKRAEAFRKTVKEWAGVEPVVLAVTRNRLLLKLDASVF